ncbi:hypothetical protein F4818DRAFT_436442 [Hypoxylon cercidicola]|nr:hypothetical protein F4818DRAFT_436442 [Hypoxylon cercidicola]
MTRNRQQNPASRHASKPDRTGYPDADGDVEMGSLSPSPASGSSVTHGSSVTRDSSLSAFSGTSYSSPLKMRITSSQNKPLFPSAATLFGPKEAYGSEDEDRTRRYKFDSLAKMIDAHVEELREKPVRGISEDHTRNNCESDGASRGEMMDVDDDITMGIE